MKTKVRFEHVNKEYTLGLGRAALPSLISKWTKSLWRGSELTRKEDKRFWALQDVNFQLSEGESLALVGANGAGKTTILKLLSNISMPTSGSITTDGQLSALIELGAGFHPDLTGRENIYLNGAILGLKRQTIERRFDEIVAFSELDRFIDTPVKRYSSGMAVRLGFAVASCIEPEILLVDEVLAVGDAAFQQKCMKRIRSLISNGTSIIFVSHNFYLIQAICNRALYLHKGCVKYQGDTKEVLDLYEQDLHLERIRKFSDNETVWHGDVTTDIEIIKVEILPQIDIGQSLFVNQQPVQIQIYYYACRPVGSAHVSVFIIRSDGLTCCMMRTKLDDFVLNVEQGQGIVRLNLPRLQLVSGAYFVEAWFLDSADSMVITPKGGRSDWFTVKGSGLTYVDDSGVFELETYWSHQPDSRAAPREHTKTI
jgi:lipopolysaccharide transport system ATP-binding protein